MFKTDENNAFTKKWPILVAKFGKAKKSNFYRIDSRTRKSLNEFKVCAKEENNNLKVISIKLEF